MSTTLTNDSNKYVRSGGSHLERVADTDDVKRATSCKYGFSSALAATACASDMFSTSRLVVKMS